MSTINTSSSLRNIYRVLELGSGLHSELGTRKVVRHETDVEKETMETETGSPRTGTIGVLEVDLEVKRNEPRD